MDIGGATLTGRQNAFSIASIMSDAIADGSCYPYSYGYGVGGGGGGSGLAPTQASHMDYYYNWGPANNAAYNSGLKGMEGNLLCLFIHRN